MRPIEIGARGSFALTVAPEHLANRFKDERLPPVLATPIMILVMENAALAAIRDFLAPGESAIGTMVNVRHIAATPVGQRVRADAEVVRTDGRLIEFKVSARDEIEEIGHGLHQRVIVDLARLARRLALKTKPSASGSKM